MNSSSNKKFDRLYLRIENRVADAENYQELVQMIQIKTLDSSTGLKEIKLDRIRTIHFVCDGDTFVYLDTFIKKTLKTPPNIIETNNKRITEYLKQKENVEKQNGTK